MTLHDQSRSALPQNESSDSPRRVGLYFTTITRHSYEIAKTLALAGHEVFVWPEHTVQDIEKADTPGPTERRYFSWVYSDADLKIVESELSVPRVEVLLFQISRSAPRFPDRLIAWIEKAGLVAAWNTNAHESTFYLNLRMELAAVYRYARFLFSFRNIIVRCGRLKWRPTGLFACAAYEFFFPHPIFLRDPELRAEMYDAKWIPETRRPIRLIFGGASHPDVRKRILDRAKIALKLRHDIVFFNKYGDFIQAPSKIADGRKWILWAARDNDDPHNVNWTERADIVPPARWPKTLQLVDFSLSPPGDERKTHRVIESLMQGVIPIIDCPDLYEVGLQDGVNCIVVQRNDWEGAVNRALDCDVETIVRMRRAIKCLADADLGINGAARHWLRRMGIVSSRSETR